MFDKVLDRVLKISAIVVLVIMISVAIFGIIALSQLGADTGQPLPEPTQPW